MKQRSILLILLTGLTLAGFGQFPPPAGQPGTTAIPADSSCFTHWASGCVITRGFVKISDTTFTYEGNNRAFYGSEGDALGHVNDSIVSLGDGGSAVLTFPVTIADGPGFDFAVFENSLSDTFLELAFIEVSSDGQRFVRIPAISYVQDTVQVPTFGNTDATRIHNFAGKYRARFGTPVDLADISDSSGIDLQHVTHIRLIDVVGCIQPAFSTFDSEGHPVNDPFPTPFHTCGFDLDAVGVINSGADAVGENEYPHGLTWYPNPAADFFTILAASYPFTFSLVSAEGKEIITNRSVTNQTRIPLGNLAHGLYFILAQFPDGTSTAGKLMKK